MRMSKRAGFAISWAVWSRIAVRRGIAAGKTGGPLAFRAISPRGGCPPWPEQTSLCGGPVRGQPPHGDFA
ncbi:MAG: hypothetical protein LBK61_11135, partial [Spirochaetaceae bacterium]|nr:hypothetical protein [Spirochaetaceae bacterium]